MSNYPVDNGHYPPPVRRRAHEKSVRNPHGGRGRGHNHVHHEDQHHGVGHHAPRSTLDIVQRPNSSQQPNPQLRQTYVGAAPNSMPKPRFDISYSSSGQNTKPDAYFSRSLTSKDVELRNNFSRYEVDPDTTSVPSPHSHSSSPGQRLPHELKGESVNSDLTNSSSSLAPSAPTAPLGDPERGFEERAARRSVKSVRTSEESKDVGKSFDQKSPSKKDRNSVRGSTISDRHHSNSSSKRSMDSVPLMTVKAKVPKGAKAGDTTEFRLPGGKRTVQIKIPKGARGGSVITVKVPKKGSTFSVANDVASLTNADVKKATAAFKKLDVHGGGYLSDSEVKLILMELGMDSSEHMVTEMIDVFDQTGNKVLDLDDFLLLYANCPLSEIDWRHLDSDALAKIERHIRGEGHAHEGFSETSGFLRALDKGVHFHRVDRQGNPHNVSVRLSVERDGLYYQSGRQVAVFPFGALWAVAQPFEEEGADLMGLVPPEVARFTILLVFGVRSKAEYAPILAAGGTGNPAGVVPTKTSMDAMELGTKYATKELFTEADVEPVVVANPKQHSSLVNSLTSLDPLTTMDLEENQPSSRGVLLLVADSMDQRNKAFNGFMNLLYHHLHHVKKSGDEKKGRKGKKVKGKTKKHAGRCDRYLQQLHHLYRPHHHVNHPPARYHVGIEAEVAYDDSYSMQLKLTVGRGRNKTVKIKDIHLPSPIFRPHMYVVAKIKKYDRETGTYDLTYTSGPYLAEEDPDGTKLFNAPDNVDHSCFQLKGVKQSLITVDLYDNYGSHQPIFIVGISIIQCTCFAYWIMVKEGGVATTSGPISGPEWTWLRIVGDLENGCPSLRYDYWRFLTYQFVHNGLVHIFSNMLMQLLFGLPLNMVHGSLRFGLIYELGVMFGALTFVTVDGGYDSVVGCSGGVYCIFGMHLAEIVTNWSLEHRGLMNHWMRLLIMAVVLGLDAYKVYTSPSDTISYSAHLGGIIAGALCGIIFLDTLETTWFHRWIGGPLTWICVILLPLGMVAYYMTSDFPPPPLGAYIVPDYYENPPCCFQARECDRVHSTFYDAFFCMLGGLEGDTQKLFDSKGNELDTCTEVEDAVESYYGLNDTYFS